MAVNGTKTLDLSSQSGAFDLSTTVIPDQFQSRKQPPPEPWILQRSPLIPLNIFT